MTDFHEVDGNSGDEKIQRDRWGRYLLPHPETGKHQPWTRATTIAGTLKDRFALEQWDQRNIVFGIGQRPALYAQASAAKLTDRDDLDAIAKRAKEAADSKAGADLGSALHTFTERIDRGEDVAVPAPYDRDIEAYRRALEIAGITTCVGWIERVVVVPELGIAGTLDRLSGQVEWSLPRIGDVKTATDKVYNDRQTNTVLTYGMTDIPLQLAIYAHASHWWDFANKVMVEMPAVDQDKAMVFHVPAGLGECRIYEVDIAAGWEAVQLAMDIRSWRKRKNLAETVLCIGIGGDESPAAKAGGEDQDVKPVGTLPGKGVEAGTPTAEETPASPSSSATKTTGNHRQRQTSSGPSERALSRDDGDQPAEGSGEAVTSPEDEPSVGPAPERFEWLHERVNAIKTHDGARRRLAGLWSLRDEIPVFPKGGPRTDEELSAVASMCDLVEMEFELPFGEPDPAARQVGPTPAEKRKAEIEAAEKAKARAIRSRQSAAKRKTKEKRA